MSHLTGYFICGGAQLSMIDTTVILTAPTGDV